jgi:hypothetical protein
MLRPKVYVLSWVFCAMLASWACAQAPSAAETPSPIRTSPLQAQAVWLGFANEAGSLDREAELRARCGEFRRVYVPPSAGNKFTDLCRQEDRTCETVCDWEGRVLPCSAISPGGRRPGSRIAMCRLTVGSPQTTQLEQTIVSDINAKLWQDQTLKTLDIRVTSKNGVVTLAGAVNTELEKAAAERLAKSENGLQQVTNQLTVKMAQPNSVSTVTVQGNPASTATVAYVVTASNDFGTIDLNTGKYSQIGHMDGLPRALGGLGIVDGKLYGGAIRTDNLYEVDASNGTVNLVGAGKISYFMTGSTTKALYAVGQDLSLYSIDTKRGVATLIGPTGFNPATAGGVALSSGSETLYMSAGTNGSAGATLYSLSTATGAARTIGFLGSGTGAPPMVFENDTLYAAFDFPSQKICTLNTTTGAPSCLASASGVPGFFYGLAPASLYPF